MKKYNKPIVWTLHDCWTFTGHCAYFDFVQCEKWKQGCKNCAQYRNTYPYALFKDASEKNYERKKEAFTGSYQGMRYRMKKIDVPVSSESEDTVTRLSVFVWPQPFCFDKTEDDLKTEHLFDFSPDGITCAVDWLNEIYKTENKRWTKD